MVGVEPSAAQGWVVKTSVRVTVCSWRVWISAMMSSYTLVTAGEVGVPDDDVPGPQVLGGVLPNLVLTDLGGVTERPVPPGDHGPFHQLITE